MIDSKGDYYKISDDKTPVIAQDVFIRQALDMEVHKSAEKKSIWQRIKEFFGQ